MLLTVADVLDDGSRRELCGRIDKLPWRDGRTTAGATAKQNKQNRQADLSSAAGKAIHGELIDRISSHPVVRAAARPKLFSNLMISQTSADDFYGPHIDNALMKKGDRVFRSDVSFTLFLTPPESYDGGELVIHTAGAEQSLKGQAGDLVLYPSSHIHQVTPVTRGVRLACVGWIESLIANAEQRSLLFDLENLRASLRQSLPTNSAELITLDKTISNLLRMWAKP